MFQEENSLLSLTKVLLKLTPPLDLYDDITQKADSAFMGETL